MYLLHVTRVTTVKLSVTLIFIIIEQSMHSKISPCIMHLSKIYSFLNVNTLGNTLFYSAIVRYMQLQ